MITRRYQVKRTLPAELLHFSNQIAVGRIYSTDRATPREKSEPRLIKE